MILSCDCRIIGLKYKKKLNILLLILSIKNQLIQNRRIIKDVISLL